MRIFGFKSRIARFGLQQTQRSYINITIEDERIEGGDYIQCIQCNRRQAVKSLLLLLLLVLYDTVDFR